MQKNFSGLSGLGNCAEVDVVNQALNNGANVNNLYLYTINTKKHESKAMCENCIYTFADKVAYDEVSASWTLPPEPCGHLSMHTALHMPSTNKISLFRVSHGDTPGILPAFSCDSLA